MKRNAASISYALDAFGRLSEDWGRLGLADTLAPAIRYAEEGVPVAPRVAFDWSEDAGRLTGAARRYYLKDGRPLRAGDVFRAPEQAELLRRIAKTGRAAFYEGEVAEDMVAALKALGGRHRLEDFAPTCCTYGDPISGSYRAHDLIEHAPNGQGATAILMLNILSRFDLTGLDPHGADRTHLEAEAAKLAYDARDRFIADPDHVTRLDHMLSEATATELASLIDPERAMDSLPRAVGAVHRETAYLTVVDPDRMAVSLIYSTYWGFGSGIASPKFGILLQNRGSGFTLEPGHPNEAGPGKRPLHTIIPAMLLEAERSLYFLCSARYDDYLAARGLTAKEWDPGTNPGLSATILFRERDDDLSFKGQQCLKCGAIQFPAQRVCETCFAKDQFEKVRLSDRIGKVVTYTFDFFFPTPNPPTIVTIVDVDGARIHLQVIELEPDEMKIGQEVEFVFRRIHESGGRPNYYWKGIPKPA